MNATKLLALADLLEARQGLSPDYDQTVFTHSCGTPACALGHWACAHPDTWGWKDGIPFLRSSPECSVFRAATLEFEVSFAEALLLFGSTPCVLRDTAEQAATFIRKFVEVRA